MKLFVIVRKDITISQSAVQAGHALAAYLLHGTSLRRWQNETLVYLGVKSLRQLENLKRKFDKDQINYVEFREPDMENEITAIATDVGNKYVERLNLL